MATATERVAGYYRVSQARDDMKAPEMYEDDITRYCEYRTLELAEVFSDIDYSGYRGSKTRPALEDLKSRRHEFSAIVIPKLSRFGRSVKDLVNLFDLFDRDGIALVFLDMNIDTSTSQGRLLRHIMAAFAEYESDVKSDYSRATQRLLAREGRPHGPMAPFGYRVVGRRSERTYEIDEATAPIVRALFHDYLDGKSLATMARELNERGVKGLKGGKWSRQRIKIILDNPAYAAFRIYESDEFSCGWPALVSRGVWNEVKAKRHGARTTYVDPPGRRSHLLSGLLVCGLCERNLFHGRAHDRVIYRCSTERPSCNGGQISAAKAERLVAQAYLAASAMADVDAGERWADAPMVDRWALLDEAIEKVVLLRRPKGNPHGRGLPMGRSITIYWKPKLSRDAFGYVGATSTLGPDNEDLRSPKGKTWAEWHRSQLTRS